MKHITKEWFIQAPWGKIALISWGKPTGEPVLLVHGRQDSAATFVPLLKLLPDNYYYVGVDLPGHGRSDAFPTGLMLSRINFVSAIDVIVKELCWESFIFAAHSFGGELCLFYNAIRPKKISKMILFDSGIVLQIIENKPFNEFYKSYEQYYDNYDSMNHDDRVYSKRSALTSVMKARQLTEEQAEIVLSRNLIEIGEDKYRLSWDKRLKTLTHLNLPFEHITYLFSLNLPPLLFIAASESFAKYKHLFTGVFIEQIKARTKYFEMKVVEGNHDVHLTNPERLASEVCDFLKKELVVSKL